MLTVANFKGSFFDRAGVLAALDRAEKRGLSRFGAFVRRTARSSIRKRKATSKPGSPPTDRGGPLKRLLFFGYDPAARSVVIGPAIFPRAKARGAPRLLEEGGQVKGGGREIVITRDPGRDKAGKFVSKGRARIKLDGSLDYKPRPYMMPAYRAELPRAAQCFKDMVK